MENNSSITLNAVDLEKRKERLLKKIKRFQKYNADLEAKKEDLTVHGHWSIGYNAGIINQLENQVDFIDDILGVV
jgi:hypothetical protein